MAPTTMSAIHSHLGTAGPIPAGPVHNTCRPITFRKLEGRPDPGHCAGDSEHCNCYRRLVRTAPAASRDRAISRSLGADAPWVITFAAVTSVELAIWGADWWLGLAPAPYLLSYLCIAVAGLIVASSLRLIFRRGSVVVNWHSLVAGTLLVGIGASIFLPLKYAIPAIVPFWLDQPLAHAERALFGAGPWLLLDRWLGWAAVPIDRLYGLWLPTQTLVLFLVMLQPASSAKSRVLIAYVLGWFLLGVVAALAFSSAGPLFYDRLLGGREFASLRPTLIDRGAWVALAESDKMWTSLATGRPGFVAGISAVPSIHVAISFWYVLAARQLAPWAAMLGLLYTVVIWVGSVQLGWHYLSDGLAGILGMLAIWPLSTRLEQALTGRMKSNSSPG